MAPQRMYLVAPAGTPVEPADIGHWLRALPNTAGVFDAFRAALCARFQVTNCFLLSSGRGAMTLLLRALSQARADPRRDEVIVPAYTCYSVPASVVKAGFRVRVCDIDPSTLSYRHEQLDQLDMDRVLAILSANLYGIPNDLPTLESLAKEKGTDLIDDAAQSMGARIGGRYSGTFGSAGLFSLDKGKNITSIQGGIVVTNQKPLADTLTQLATELPAPSPLATLLDAAKLVAYAAVLPPRAYWLTLYMPFLNLGKTVYTTDYPIRRYSPLLSPVASRMFSRLDDLSSIRRQNADALRTALNGLPGLRFASTLADTEPVYTRLPIFISDPEQRVEVLRRLNRRGVVASVSYPQAISDIAELQNHLTPGSTDTPGARQVAREIITLPTHPYVTTEDVALIRDTLNEVLA